MVRTLIVNADDCNLTSGVTQAILDCHDHGIVTSTTFMVNLPVDSQTTAGLLKRKKLGIGLHLNLTLGRPVSAPRKVPSLVDEDGNFRKYPILSEDKGGLRYRRAALHGTLKASAINLAPTKRLFSRKEVEIEYLAQIERFRKIFGRLPTHLDTHHQLHDHALFYTVLASVARRYRLPLRRSRMNLMRTEKRDGPACPDYLFGNLSATAYWRKEPLLTLLLHLPQGTSEIMCHPGIPDRDLKAVSSFTVGREAEWKLFRSVSLRRFVERQRIRLSHYGLCYTK